MAEPIRHFLDLDTLPAERLRCLIDHAVELRRTRNQPARDPSSLKLAGKTVFLIFEMASTRTRVSFDIAVHEMGGHPMMLDDKTTQIARGETDADTARVLSRYGHAIVIRSRQSERMRSLADHATIPVINAMNDQSHPCQILADVMAFELRKGPIRDRVIAWTGDSNNVARSWIHAAGRLGFELRIACPDALRPRKEDLDAAAAAGARIQITDDPREAADGADGLVTDSWHSMAHEHEGGDRDNLLRPFQLNEELLGHAAADAVVMHCLPAYRGREITEPVLEGARSLVWDEAECRLHVQKAILAWCFGYDHG